MTIPPTLTASKLNIINAAARVAESVGASKLTLERVAIEAGISKGGLLYHYPNKSALLEGMVSYTLARIEDRREIAESAEARIADFILLDTTESGQDRAIAQSLLAAAAENPRLLEPARKSSKLWLDAAARHSEEAVVIFLASEGLRFLDLLNLLPSAAVRKRLINALNAVGERAGDRAQL